jgi:hypothetical protein
LPRLKDWIDYSTKIENEKDTPANNEPLPNE